MGAAKRISEFVSQLATCNLQLTTRDCQSSDERRSASNPLLLPTVVG